MLLELSLLSIKANVFMSVLFRYRPTLTVEFVHSELGYADCNQAREAVHKLLTEQGAKLTADLSKIDCKHGLVPPPAQT